MPQPLRTVGGGYVYVEAPRTLTVRGRTFLFGTPIFVWRTRDPKDGITNIDSTTSPARRFAGLRLERSGRVTPIPGPAGGPLTYLRVGLDAKGLAHAIWSPLPDSGQANSSLVHSTFDGQAWTPPEPIPNLPPHRWDTNSQSEVFAVDSGIATIVVGWSREGKHRALYLLSNRATRWSVQTIALQSPPAYTRALATGHDIVIAYVAANSEALTDDRNSVFVRRMAGTSPSPSRPILVFGSGDGEAHAPVLVRDPRGPLYLLWRQENRSPQSSHRILLSMSRDSGHTWTAPVTLGSTSSRFYAAGVVGLRIPLIVAAGAPSSSARVRLWEVRGSAVKAIEQTWPSEFPMSLSQIGEADLLLSLTVTNRLDSPLGGQDIPRTTVVRWTGCRRTTGS
ncbi:MAG: hypothetical protein HOP28_01180 [Gemmatimonadales bacterium]|nr:hypothetical protein [Gemmatimonadales bacterium]